MSPTHLIDRSFYPWGDHEILCTKHQALPPIFLGGSKVITYNNCRCTEESLEMRIVVCAMCNV